MVLVDTNDWQISSFGKPLIMCMYETWDLVTCTYLTTQKIRMSYARYGVRINQIKSINIKTTSILSNHLSPFHVAFIGCVYRFQ